MSTSNGTLFCANHPDIQTSLRCNRCEKPICTRCATLTPTGYRCKECISSQQKAFETALQRDFFLGCGVAVVMAFIGSVIIQILPLGILTLLLAPAMGTAIGEAARFVTQKRRSKNLFKGVAISVILGTLPIILLQLALLLYLILQGWDINLASELLPLFWQGVYAAMAASSTYYRLAGISIRP